MLSNGHKLIPIFQDGIIVRVDTQSNYYTWKGGQKGTRERKTLGNNPTE